MEKRMFGRTGHASTLAIFGAAALYNADEARAERAIKLIMDAGVNHIDAAASYGNAEVLLGPWMRQERKRFFLGSKTEQRGSAGAREELERSLELLQTDHLDLHQIHAVTEMAALDAATGPNGALEAMVRAREEGLIRFIGVTGHGVRAPEIFLEALRRFAFDSVLFPVSFVLYANPEYRREAQELLRVCREKNVGVMAIKAVTRGPWGSKPKIYDPWYEPFDDARMIQQATNFALSQEITGVCTVSDVDLLPLQLEACERFAPMSMPEQEALVGRAGEFEPLFT